MRNSVPLCSSRKIDDKKTLNPFHEILKTHRRQLVCVHYTSERHKIRFLN